MLKKIAVSLFAWAMMLASASAQNVVTVPGSVESLLDGYGSGNKVLVSPNGTLNVSNDPFSEFNDSFSGSSIDTTNNWSTNNSSGTTSQTGGVLTVASGAATGDWGGLGSKQSFTPYGIFVPACRICRKLSELYDHCNRPAVRSFYCPWYSHDGNRQRNARR